MYSTTHKSHTPASFPPFPLFPPLFCSLTDCLLTDSRHTHTQIHISNTKVAYSKHKPTQNSRKPTRYRDIDVTGSETTVIEMEMECIDETAKTHRRQTQARFRALLCSTPQKPLSGRQRTVPVPVPTPNLEPTDVSTLKIRAFWNPKSWFPTGTK